MLSSFARRQFGAPLLMESAEGERSNPELYNSILESADLLKQVAESELKGSKKILLDPKVLSILDSLLLDVHTILQPQPINYEQRRLLVQVFNKMAHDSFGNKNGFPLVEAFGSFTMDLFTSASDLDLSINLSNDMIECPRDMKISILKKLAKVLFAHQREGFVRGVMPIMRARVPVLKVMDCETEIECDISVDNKDGISRSMFYSAVTSIDERFRILSFLMKAWAKAHNVNSSKDHTMNSLSIISLVAFHLQTRNPPILPPFCALLRDGTDTSNIRRNITKFKQYGKENQESVGELFLALLVKLSSVENLWQHGLCASIYEGSWIHKKWKSGICNMNVEDFLDRSENFARSVGKDEMPRICESVKGSLSNLSSFSVSKMGASKLKELLFGSIEPKPSNGVQSSIKDSRRRKRKIPNAKMLCSKVTADKKGDPSDDLPVPVNPEASTTATNVTVGPTTAERPHNTIHKRKTDRSPNFSNHKSAAVRPAAAKRPKLEPSRWKAKHSRTETPNALPNAYNHGLVFAPQPALLPYHHHQPLHPDDYYIHSGHMRHPFVVSPPQPTFVPRHHPPKHPDYYTTSHGQGHPFVPPPQPAFVPHHQLRQHPDPDVYMQPGHKPHRHHRRPFDAPPQPALGRPHHLSLELSHEDEYIQQPHGLRRAFVTPPHGSIGHQREPYDQPSHALMYPGSQNNHRHWRNF